MARFTPRHVPKHIVNYAYVYHPSGTIYSAHIVKDQNACFKALYAGPVGKDVGDRTVAEFMAFRSAADTAMGEGANLLEVEGENDHFFQLLRGQTPPPSEALRELVDICHHELRSVRSLLFFSVKPEANWAVMELAKQAMKMEATWFFYDSAPHEFAQLLESDVMSFCARRQIPMPPLSRL